MTPLQIIFLITAVVTLGGALMVVTTRNLIHAALWLVLALFGVAVTYALLQAGFLAVVQVVVYIGAIAILIIFAIMLTRDIGQDDRPGFNENWVWALVLTALLGGGLLFALTTWPDIGAPAAEVSSRFDPVTALGLALVDPNGYVVAFELASVLLLAALIGALIVAWDRK